MKNKIIPILILVVAIGVAWYIYNDLSKTAVSDSTEVATSTIKNNLGIDFEGEGITVEEVPIEDVKQPSLDRKIVIPNSFPIETRKVVESNIKNIIAEIKQDPKRIDKWIEYGSYLNAINDYEGAREMWEYALAFTSNAPEIYSNLGFLYGYNLKDSVKAEERFLLSIAVAPKEAQYYVLTAQFYIDVMQDKQKALSIINKGLVEIPKDENLLKMSARLEK